MSTTDLDFAQALSVAEAAAVLFSQKIVETTGEPAPGAVLVHDPHLALRTLQQAARAAGNPRVKAVARQSLSTFYGVDVDRHPELVDPQFRMPGRRLLKEMATENRADPRSGQMRAGLAPVRAGSR